MGYFFCMYQFPKHEHLCGETGIKIFFSHSKRFTAFPLRVHYTRQTQCTYSRFMVSVPKKLIKHAVQRNLLKRRIREAYRLHKPTQAVNMAVVYMDTEVASYATIEKAMLKAMQKINQLAPTEP